MATMKSGSIPPLQVETYPVTIDNYSSLICPRCGSNNLHQCGYRIYERNGEDGPTTVIEVVGVEVRKLQDNDDLNPSSRRDGLHVLFACEHCDPDWGVPKLALAIQQHKGITFVKWRWSPRLILSKPIRGEVK